MPALPSGEGRQQGLLMGWEVIVMLGGDSDAGR